jgi:hypothetical protein
VRSSTRGTPKGRGRQRRIRAARAALYAGLYDGSTGETGPRTVGNVTLLNPAYDDDDPAGRRFALIEID